VFEAFEAFEVFEVFDQGLFKDLFRGIWHNPVPSHLHSPPWGVRKTLLTMS
jgi:hypothetical protein